MPRSKPPKPLREQRRLINAVLAFANASPTRAADKAESVIRWFGPGPFKTIPANERFEAFAVHDQSTLVKQLDHIVKKGAPDAAWLDRMLAKVTSRLSFDKRIVARYEVDGVEAGIALAGAFLVESGLPLRRCESCLKFFVIYDPLKRRRKYCSSPHCMVEGQRDKAAAKMRRYRNRKRGK